MKKKNAANHQVFRDLEAALTDIEEDSNMRVVVLTGQEDVFSAGADVSGFDFQKVSAGMYFMELVAKVFNHFEYIPKPVVMAVNGIAYGFGAGITLTGDIVIASDRAKFSIREINHGAIPIETLTRGMEVMGKHRIAYLSLMANDITAEEARSYGIVNVVVPHDKFREQVARVCDKLKDGAPFATAGPTNVFHGSEFVFAHMFGIHGGSTAEAALGLVAAGIAQVAGFIGNGPTGFASISHKGPPF